LPTWTTCDLDDITLDSTLNDTELNREDLATVNLDTVALDDEFPATLPLLTSIAQRGKAWDVPEVLAALGYQTEDIARLMAAAVVR